MGRGGSCELETNEDPEGRDGNRQNRIDHQERAGRQDGESLRAERCAEQQDEDDGNGAG